jgi:hypothetical protein
VNFTGMRSFSRSFFPVCITLQAQAIRRRGEAGEVCQ